MDCAIDADAQLAEVLAVCRRVLEACLLGAYLHGSAVGELHPHSDLDVLVVVDRALTDAEKRELVDGLKKVSEYPAADRRPVEVTVVVRDEVRPWRYPPRMELQYGEWLRDQFERGDPAPWTATPNPDLASLVTVVLLADWPLIGPPAAEVLDPVPVEDYLSAIAAGIDELVTDLDWDTRNVVLTLARIWSTVSTGLLRSKDAAAEWASARLPAEHRSVVDRARRAYLGELPNEWGGTLSSARSCVEHLVGRIGDHFDVPSTLPTSIDLAPIG